jgi:hypothetical protein
MSILHRRYEILIPLRFNDDSPVPDTLIAETLLELRSRFGAVSSETQIIRGQWEHEGETYRDEHFRLFVDVEDLPGNREFFRQLKERLKQRFRQLDIWITSHPIDVLWATALIWRGKRAKKIGLHRAVCDYIAGMTDRYLILEYQRLFGLKV